MRNSACATMLVALPTIPRTKRARHSVARSPLLYALLEDHPNIPG
jgi:hypothetical protein